MCSDARDIGEVIGGGGSAPRKQKGKDSRYRCGVLLQTAQMEAFK